MPPIESDLETVPISRRDEGKKRDGWGSQKNVGVSTPSEGEEAYPQALDAVKGALQRMNWD